VYFREGAWVEGIGWRQEELKMVCEHLRVLDEELTRLGVEVIYRDEKPWSENCRCWTRFACYLDLASIRARLRLAECVTDWEFKDHWQGEERGFVCETCQDAVIGDYQKIPGRMVVR
jgi:hypothetical protein